uniref:NADH dehydrogenase subunit 3 n=1 Tax=Labidocera rotunda TaxID=207950 RepID=UPI002036E391|nr:NADH dehydrogenase subunit 3 [Labidocera rotunda]URC16604.1 NADH dehydrogenase subunit 3 [Labidocera rotunda]
MMSFIMALSVVLILGMLLVVLGVGLSTKFSFDREKSSPFECGFTPKSVPRLPLSLRFFLIAIVFLIFDVELVLIFPVIISQAMANPLISSLLLGIFLVILTGGLYFEINQGSLNWAS